MHFASTTREQIGNVLKIELYLDAGIKVGNAAERVILPSAAKPGLISND